MDHADFKEVGYLASDEILTLTKLALTLDKPMLIEGPPGTGKTSIAKAMAKHLNTKLLRIQCFEGITAEQVIGEFNYQKQLLEIAKKTDSDIFTTDFFIPRPLLESLQSETRVVLLLDELDRADEEFEAFLLEALGEKQITIPELGTMAAKSSPIVLITSNGTRELSPALRRRSLFLALDYPESSREAEIIKMHVPELENELELQIVSLIRKLRANEDISQPPSISESIELAKTLVSLGAEYLDVPKVNEILGVVIKNQADMAAARRMLG